MALRILVHEWVTGGGLAGLPVPESWAREGRAMRRAVVDDFLDRGARAVVTLDPRFADEEGPWEPVAVAAGREEATLRRHAPLCDYTLLIAPETAGTLAALTELVEAAGGRSLNSLPAAVALSADKHRLAAFLLKKDVATVPAEWYDRWAPHTPAFGYPAVVKPVDGAGSLDTFLLDGPGDRPTPTSWAGDLLIQPYCPGTAMSASFLVGADGGVTLLGVGWQHVDPRGGRLVYRGGRLPAPPELGQGEPRRAVEAVAGLRGFVGVDFVLNYERGPVVIEINPRLTTSFVGLRRLYLPGELARAWLEAVEGRPGRTPPSPVEPAPREGSVRFRDDGTIEPDPDEDAPRATPAD